MSNNDQLFRESLAFVSYKCGAAGITSCMHGKMRPVVPLHLSSSGRSPVPAVIIGMKAETKVESIRHNDDPLVVNDDQENKVVQDSSLNVSEPRGCSVLCQDRTVNTHNSILNIGEEDEEEEDDENTSFGQSEMFFDERTPNSPKPKKISSPYKHIPETPPPCSKRCCDIICIASTPKNSSLLDQMTENFVERLCFQQDQEKISNSACVGDTDDPKDLACWHEYQRLLADDILELLGCAAPPDEDEIKKVWNWDQATLFCNKSLDKPQRDQKPDDLFKKPNRPRRYSLRERAIRIHRLKTEQAMLQQRTALSPSPTSVLYPIHRNRSMDNAPSLFASPQKNRFLARRQEDDLEKRIGCGLEPILPEGDQKEIELDFIETEDDLGYDSDPGEFTKRNTFDGDLKNEETPPLSLSPPFQSTRSGDTGTAASSHTTTRDQDVSGEVYSIKFLVHETFNFSWTLTWHPGNSKGISRPRCISVWFERGTHIQNKRSLLEPNLMWREAYQADLPKRKLNQSTQNPYSIRLLNLCRILEAPMGARYPLARPSCCFFLQTGSPKQEFLFEAASPALRNDIIRRWKLCVARFASLAVTEDLDAICEEFFTPMVSSNMLVVPGF